MHSQSRITHRGQIAQIGIVERSSQGVWNQPLHQERNPEDVHSLPFQGLDGTGVGEDIVGSLCVLSAEICVSTSIANIHKHREGWMSEFST